MNRSEKTILSLIKSGFSVGRVFTGSRILGVGSLMMCFAVATGQESSFITISGISDVIYAHWLLIGGLFLVARGYKASLNTMFIAMIPFCSELLSSWLTETGLTQHFIFSVIITMFVIRVLILKLLDQILQQINEQ